MISSSRASAQYNKAPNDNALGLDLRQKKGTLRCTWDFSANGGAVGDIKLNDQDGNAATLPSGAIVTQVYSDTETAVTTSASGTLALKLNGTGDLKAALAAASWTGIQAGVPVGTAATMVKATAERRITAEIATGALTAGKVHFFVDYVLSNAL